MEEIKKCLTEFVNSPYDSKINFNLGYAYEKEKQYASAFSYYLRCAEFTEDKVLGSEALLRCSLCLNNQGGRDQKELHFMIQTMMIFKDLLQSLRNLFLFVNIIVTRV